MTQRIHIYFNRQIKRWQVKIRRDLGTIYRTLSDQEEAFRVAKWWHEHRYH